MAEGIGGDRESRIFSVFRRLVFWLACSAVFFGVPFIWLSFFVGKAILYEENERLSRRCELLDKIIYSMVSNNSTRNSFEDLVGKLLIRSQNSTEPRKFLRKGLTAFRRKFGNICRFVAVDFQGKIDTHLDEEMVSPDLVKKTYCALREFNENGDGENILRSMWEEIKVFLGPQASLDQLMDGHQRFFEVNVSDKNSWFGYWLGKNGGLMGHFDRPRNWDVLIEEARCRRSMKVLKIPGFRAGIWHREDTEKIPSNLRQALHFYFDGGRKHVIIRNEVYSFASLNPTSAIWGKLPYPDISDLKRKRNVFLGLGTAIFAILAFLCYLVVVRRHSLFISLRYQTIALFFYVAGIPLLMISVAGREYLRQVAQNKVEESNARVEKALSAFDEGYPQLRGVKEQKLRKLLRENRFEDASARKITTEKLCLSEIFSGESEVMIFDRKGKLVWEIARTTTWKGVRGRRLMEGLTRNLLAHLNREVSAEGFEPTALLIDLLAFDVNPLLEMTENLEKVVEFDWAKNQSYSFLMPFRDRAGKFSHILIGNWRKHKLEKEYIISNFHQIRRGCPLWEAYVLKPSSSVFLPRQDDFLRSISWFVRKLELHQRTVFGMTTWRGEKFLLTGVKPKELGQCLLIGVQRWKTIAGEVEDLERRIYLSFFLCLLMSIFLGDLLGKRFLTPVKGLTGGVEAINRRDFSHRLSVKGYDELGQLSETFNRVLDGLSDLEVARAVQETFYPSGEQRIGEYTIFGRTVPANQVGGDYFAIKSLKNGKILILVGDVSGHGVPAALIMAMAKAVLEDVCLETAGLHEIINSLNSVILKCFRREWMMTCFFCLLDVSNHLLQCANAGHPYPIQYRRGEAPKEIRTKGLPLGSRKILSPDILNLETRPGDTFLLCSDGLIETSIGEEIVGSGGVMTEVEKLVGKGPKADCHAVFDWNKAIRGEKPQEDDITVVFFARA